jgi:intracellular multiplication protein IcmO
VLNLRQLLDLRLGGFKDNIAVLAVIGGGMAANPIFADVRSVRLIGAAVTAAGAYMLGRKIAAVLRPRVFTSAVNITSSAAEDIDLSQDADGMLMGFTVDGGKPVVIPWDNWMRHAFIVGQSGMGKTVLGEWLMFQQIMRGGGIVWIDGKIDSDNIAKLNAMCAFAGRRHDLRVVNPDDPSRSNTYNPILFGDADEVASRIISLIPSAENNPGADYFRQSANQGVTTTVGSIRRAGFGYTFRDLSILLQSERAMMHLATLLPPNSEAARMYGLFLERFQSVDRQGNKGLDIKKIADLFGGVGGRLFSFGEGNFGQVTETYDPEVRMYDDIIRNRIIYIALPTMGKAESASQFGKMAVGDYRSAIAKIQSLPKEERPWPPTLGFFDEAGSYVNQAWARIFEQSRSAHQVLVPAIQTMANLDAVSAELREMVMGNTVTKACFRVGTAETSEMMADAFGTENVAALSVSSSGGGGENATAGTGVKQSMSRSASLGYSERQEEVHRVTTNDLKSLEMGEAIVTTAGQKLYHVKIPRVEFSKEFLAEVGPFEVNRLRPRFVKGLKLFEKFGKAAGASA